MTATLGLGLFLVLAALVYVLDIIRRKGERFEVATAMFYGEWGVMQILKATTPSPEARIGGTVLLTLGMFATMLMWWKLFRQYKRESAERAERERHPQ